MLHSKSKQALPGLAGHLVHEGLLDYSTAENALEHAKRLQQSFTRYLVKNNVLTSEDIFQYCKKVFGLPPFENEISHIFPDLIHPELIHRYRVIALDKQDGTLHIGITDPTDQAAIDAVMLHTGLRIFPLLIAEDKLNQLIETHYYTPTSRHLELTLLKELSTQEESLITQENTSIHDEPLIKYVDNIIQHALEKSASDIHIEPYENHCRIRYRQDGILYEMAEIPIHLAARLTTRLKVIAKLDISERRLPQDGRFQLGEIHASPIDIRINTCPTLFGEKIVLRLLDNKKSSLEMDALGFTESQKKHFLATISQPQGMILVTGPTGSGKTVTLYSALRYLNTTEKNISTVEDPVEIQLTGINQVNIHSKIGLDFATVLRTFLRQDPDVIMIGEIRDAETAEIAIEAAQTGHLVLSTAHTNSASETLIRLQSMGIPPYNLVSSISLVIAQRLARKLCQHCKLPERIPPSLLTSLGITKPNNIYRAVGCQHCLQGYQGRIGIYDFLPMTESIAEQILSGREHERINTLRNQGMAVVMQGITSLAEINRIIRA